MADSVSALLDAIGNTDAATVVNISFGGGPGQLPGKINGEAYSINFTGDCVIVTSGSRVWMSKPVNTAIPENLEKRAYNITEYESLVFEKFTGEHSSAGYFYMERAMIDVSGDISYMTLVYWD